LAVVAAARRCANAVAGIAGRLRDGGVAITAGTSRGSLSASCTGCRIPNRSTASLLLLLQPQRIPPGTHRHNAVPPFYVYGPLLGATIEVGRHCTRNHRNTHVAGTEEPETEGR
jgi:hypothetical protein